MMADINARISRMCANKTHAKHVCVLCVSVFSVRAGNLICVQKLHSVHAPLMCAFPISISHQQRAGIFTMLKELP